MTEYNVNPITGHMHLIKWTKRFDLWKEYCEFSSHIRLPSKLHVQTTMD